MRTSTKIFIAYVAAICVVQAVFGFNSYLQYKELQPKAMELCEKLNRTQIHHVEMVMPENVYTKFSKKRQSGLNNINTFKGFFFTHSGTSNPPKYFEFGTNLENSYIHGDTLHVDCLNMCNGWGNIYTCPELRTKTLISPEGVETKDYTVEKEK